jgi:hypothetical protein
MRTLRDLLPKKEYATPSSQSRGTLDEKTVFYVAKKIFGEEYGVKGSENIIPLSYKEKKLFLSTRSSLWSNEVWLEREGLKEKINNRLGEEAVREVKIQRN